MKQHVQWAAVTVVLAVASARAAPPVSRLEILVPDLPGYVTLKADLHLHTVFSDGHVWPPVRVDEAWRDGLDAIALTDHIEYQPKTNDIPTRHQRPYEVAVGAAREKNVLLIRGAEITKSPEIGHYNAIFVTNIDMIAHDDVLESLRRAKAQGAVSFWNHPGWRVPPGQPIVRPHHEEMIREGLIQGIELFNDYKAYTNVWDWANERNLVPLGNSDYHDPIDPPLADHSAHRTMTLVFAKERTLEGLREALLAGRTIAWDRDRLIGRPEWLMPFVRACLVLDRPHHRDAKGVVAHLRNVSHIPFTLRRVEGAGPAEVLAPANRTILLRVAVAPGAESKLVYEAVNAESAPGRHPTVEWSVAHSPR